MSITRHALPALLLAALPLVACDVGGSDNRRILIEQLNDREELWAAAGSPTYTVEMTRECNCPHNYRVILEVVNDAVVSGEHVVSGEALTPAELEVQMTIDDVFDLVRNALNDGAAAVNVAYNRDFGYIELVYIDYEPRTTTDDIAISIDAYDPVPTTS